MAHTRRTGNGPEIVEVAPERCPNGHRLVRGQVIVGWDPGAQGGRTYLCRACGMETVIQHDGTVEHRQKSPVKRD